MQCRKNPEIHMKNDKSRLDRILTEERSREQGYRELALKLFPWICGRCAREFTRTNLRELTVHHKDHNHGNNPSDGSNWELLCLYCHDNEHQRQLEAHGASAVPSGGNAAAATFSPFANLKDLLNRKQ